MSKYLIETQKGYNCSRTDLTAEQRVLFDNVIIYSDEKDLKEMYYRLFFNNPAFCPLMQIFFKDSTSSGSGHKVSYSQAKEFSGNFGRYLATYPELFNDADFIVVFMYLMKSTGVMEASYRWVEENVIPVCFNLRFTLQHAAAIGVTGHCPDAFSVMLYYGSLVTVPFTAREFLEYLLHPKWNGNSSLKATDIDKYLLRGVLPWDDIKAADLEIIPYTRSDCKTSAQRIQREFDALKEQALAVVPSVTFTVPASCDTCYLCHDRAPNVIFKPCGCKIICSSCKSIGSRAGTITTCYSCSCPIETMRTDKKIRQ